MTNFIPTIIKLAVFMFAIVATKQTFAQDCIYLAYDGFNYNTNTALHSLGGGAGWSEPWQVQNANNDVPGYQTYSSVSSLSYSDLQALGTHASGGIYYLTAGRKLNTSASGPFSDFIATSSDLIGTTYSPSRELWVSVLLRKERNNNEGISIDLHDNSYSPCNDCTSNRIGFGYFGEGSNDNGTKYWGIRSGSNVINSDMVVNIGETTLIVARIVFNHAGSTNIQLYVNPFELGNNQPSSPNLNWDTTVGHTFKNISAYMGASTLDGSFDEIRMAGSYRCVTPNAGVPVNAPPIAEFAATPTSGSTPLLVSFNASSSYDPEGESLQYSWNFGDGSPLGSGVTTSHTYTSGVGVIQVTLTVTDPAGLSGTKQSIITLLNNSGTFGCLETASAISLPSCEMENGQINLGLPTGVSATLSFNGNTLTPVNGHEYHNLSPGIYTLSASGSNGCSSQRNLYLVEDETTCPDYTFNRCDLEIGTNLGGISDWNPERPFRNHLKNTRELPIVYTFECSCWSLDHLYSELEFDADGYPTYLPQTTSGGQTVIRYFLSADFANLVIGQRYVLLYDGQGNLDLEGGLSLISETPGRIEFEMTGDGAWVNVVESQLGNHVRNIRIVRLSDEHQDVVNQPFYSEFLNKIEPFSVLRFMDWGHTNNNPNVNWSDRLTPTHVTYGGEKGVPYEIMIQLANQTQKDVWICVPHAANNNYITEMATLFKEGLDPNLTVYLEYSNEVWNWIFDQSHYNTENNPSGLMYGRAYAVKAKNVFDIWHNVFGSDKNRVKRVLGIQAGFNYLNENILSHLNEDDWDMGSPTHYVGLNHESTGNPILNASSNATDIIENAWNHFQIFKEDVKQDYRNIKLYGKEIVTYEGGQHFVGNVFGETYPYQQAMYDAQFTPEIHEMYMKLHDSILTWGAQLATNFSLASTQESIYGSWGVMDHIDIPQPYLSTAPKYQALLDYINDDCEPKLSVSWLDLKVLCNGLDYFVNWSTAMEEDNRIFEIQISFDGKNWQTEGTVDGGGNSTTVQQYRYSNKNRNFEKVYLRIKQEDWNGNYSYSPIDSFSCVFEPKYTLVLPNPTFGDLRIISDESTEYWTIYDTMGKIVSEGVWKNGDNTVNLSGEAEGVYFLKINKVNSTETTRIILMR